MSVPEPACPPIPTIDEWTAVPSKYVEIPVTIGERKFIPGENVILAYDRGPLGRPEYRPVDCLTIVSESDTELKYSIVNNKPYSINNNPREVTKPKNLYANNSDFKFYRLSDIPKAHQLAKESYMMNKIRKKTTAQTKVLGNKETFDQITDFLARGVKKSRKYKTRKYKTRKYKTRRYKRSRLSRRKKHH
jgi:hypothetical protein